MNLVIRRVVDDFDLKKLREFMFGQPQLYPGYEGWVDEVCIPGIERGERRGIIAVSHGLVVGDAVWKDLGERRIELKNFRIGKGYSNRFLGRFLLEQVQAENPGKDLGLDVSVRNFEGVRFFLLNGCRIVGAEALYRQGQLEYLMEKPALAVA